MSGCKSPRKRIEERVRSRTADLDQAMQDLTEANTDCMR